jgi:hypothetical protein
MPKRQLSNVHEHFKVLPKAKGRDTKDVQCRHCLDIKAQNITRQQTHLFNCKAYHVWQITEKEKKAQRKRPRLEGRDEQEEDSEIEEVDSMRHWDRVTTAQALELDDAATLMIVECGLPFSFFEKETVKTFIKLLRPAYKPPQSTAVRTTLLDRCYNKIKTQVDTIISEERYINLSLDGSDNVSHDRVVNISVGTKKGCFYYHNLAIGSATADASYNCDQVMNWIKIITKDKPERINSISLDTCSTQFATFKAVAQHIPRCLMIPCNPHGLNLLAGDIIKSPAYVPIYNQATAITSHMNSSNKQYQIFKEYQTKFSEKRRSLATSGKTRWNSNIVKFDRISENPTALQAWKRDSRIQRQIHEAYTHKDGSRRLCVIDTTLADPHFFQNLRELADLIRPIDNAIVKSQADSFHIGQVLPQWKVIWDELKLRCHNSIANWNLLWPVLQDRWNRQLTDVHLIAYYLLPQTILDSHKPTQPEIIRCLSVLREYIEEKDYLAAEDSFYEFLQQRGDFHQDLPIWSRPDEKVFWLRAGLFAQPLAQFCERLWNTLTTEAASERAFSAMKLLHSNIRNRMTPERVDKQLFIQINYRVLNREPRKPSVMMNASATTYSDSDNDSDYEDIHIEMVPDTA